VPDWFTASVVNGAGPAPLRVLLRLLLAFVLGAVVAFIYRRARGESSSSFTVTLVLLAILIAMVTQVIGDNIARAFSLVGALSIVRFRTVVRDTQDTAYVIFAVAVGMAVGANDLWVAFCGITVVALAAAMTQKGRGHDLGQALPFRLHVRVGLGHDADALLGGTIDAHTVRRQLVSLATARQGASVDVSYRAALASDRSADELVRALNRIEGVQSVAIERVDEVEP
jgi:hypothetical protein